MRSELSKGRGVAILLLFTVAILARPAGLNAQSYASLGDENLASYIEQALRNNPSVSEAFSRYQAALAKAPQVSTLPDPVLSFTQYSQSPETRVGPQQGMVSITQRIPWWGKLSDREQIARKEAEALAAGYEVRRDEVVRRVKLAYYDLLYIDSALKITEEDLEILRHFETLAQARYAQGIGLQQAVVKLQAEVTRDLNRLEVLRRQRVDAEATLNALLDASPNEARATASSLVRPKVDLRYETLISLARENRPELEGDFHQIEAEEQRIRLARREYLPDLTLGASYADVGGREDPAGRATPPPDNGKNVLSFTVGVNIPIFRAKYDGALREASERFAAARHRYRDTANQVAAGIRATSFRIETIATQVNLFENTLLPQAEQALRSSESAYSTGTLGVLDLLDSERILLDVRLGLAQLNADYLKGLAELERTIGTEFPRSRP